MKITFLHSHKAFLPEVMAYTALFRSLGHECATVLPSEMDSLVTDVEWHFMGSDRITSKKSRIKIHEYSTASVGSIGPVKDFIKKAVSPRPDFRIFLSSYVREKFAFKDDVPFGFRDMGVDPGWILPGRDLQDVKKYDFVYLGELGKAREMEKLFDAFTRPDLKNQSLLVAGRNYAELQQKYAACNNIIFQGPFDHASIPSVLKQARYGINYIVDKEPFNRQTSTKFLEYAACGLPIISTNYEWVRKFEKQYGGRYFYLEKDLSNLSRNPIQQFNFEKPDLSDWTWEQQIRRSGVIEFLEKTGSEKKG